MKTLVFFIHFFVLSFSLPSLADLAAPRILSATLLEFDIKHDFLEGANLGGVSIDLDQQEITLTLQQPWSCPEGFFCAAVMPAPQVIALPIVEIKEDACGITQYTASLSQDENGIQERLTVQDLSELTCRIHFQYETHVTYTSMNVTERTLIQSSFEGHALNWGYQPAPIIHAQKF